MSPITTEFLEMPMVGPVWDKEWFQVQWPPSWFGENITVKELDPVVAAAAIWGGPTEAGLNSLLSIIISYRTAFLSYSTISLLSLTFKAQGKMPIGLSQLRASLSTATVPLIGQDLDWPFPLWIGHVQQLFIKGITAFSSQVYISASTQVLATSSSAPLSM